MKHNPIAHLLPLLAIAALFAACATLNPDANALVVRAEQTRAVAVATFNAFLDFEYAHRYALWEKDPNIKRYADFIRANERNWILTLTQMKNAYKASKSDADKSALAAILATIEEAIRGVQRHLDQNKP